MFNRYNRFFMGSFYFLDIAFTIFSLFLTNLLSPMIQNWSLSGNNFHISWEVYLFVILIWSISFRSFPIYTSKRALPLRNEIFGVSIAIISSWVILVSVLFLTVVEFPRPSLILFGILNLAILLSFHLALRLFLRIIRYSGYNLKSVLIVGAGYAGQLIAKELLNRSWTGYYIIGFLDDDPRLLGQTVLSIPVLGDIGHICDVVRTMNPEDEIVISLPPTQYFRIEELIRKVENIPVNIRVVPDFFRLAYIRPYIEDMWGIPLIGIRTSCISPSVKVIKRAIDLIGATIGIILFAPAMALISLLIYIDSDGGVLFIQERIGENGKPFMIYKFRTMVKDAEKMTEHLADLNELEGPAFKIKNDPRRTSVGRLLRRTSLDELPQFFNVLKGEMSLVGPRPEESRLVRKYNTWQRRRLMMKPGMTGPAQVKGRGDLPINIRVKLEEEYINNYSIWKDFEILLKTVPSIIRGTGSY